MKRIASILMCVVLLLYFPVETEAYSIHNIQNTITYSGTLENGVNYTMHIAKIPAENGIINIVHKKQYAIDIVFDGNITPPSTWMIEISENNIEYSGTLALDYYFYDNFFWDKCTKAHYKGTLHALI